MNLCLSLLPWARFRTTNACIKLHTLMDLRGSIPDDQRDERLAFLTNQFTLPAKTIAADGSNQFNSHIGRFLG